MPWSQQDKDAGYLEFLAHEIEKQEAFVNGLVLTVVSRELRIVAKRMREGYDGNSNSDD